MQSTPRTKQIIVFGTLFDFLCHVTEQHMGFLPECEARVDEALNQMWSQ